MKKRELCSFGKKINHRLIALDQSKGWLIEEVKRHTGLYFDRSYLRKIETGQLATPKIVELQYVKYLASLFRMIVPKEQELDKMYFLKKKSGLHMHLEN